MTDDLVQQIRDAVAKASEEHAKRPPVEVSDHDRELGRGVSDRINAACEAAIAGDAPMIASLTVTSREEEACDRLVRENLANRGLAPFPFVDSKGRLLFKNVGLEVEHAKAE